MREFLPTPTNGHHLVVTPGTLHISRRLALVVFILVVGSGAVGVATLRSGHTPDSNAAARPNRPRETASRAPWGRIRRAPFDVEPPTQYADRAACPVAPIWRFQGYTQPSITELLAGLSLSAPQREALLGATHCQAAGCTMTPPLDQVEAIAPVERARIYTAILAQPENLLALPLVSRRLTDPALWSDPRFSPEMAAIIRDSSFHYGGGWMFADSSSLCARVHSDSERVNVVRALLSTPSWLLSLDVQPGDDVEALARYWARGPRHKDVRQFLTSFSRAPGGTTVDVVHLLPVFPRAHLNTFDALDGPQHDCHWSAMNFFEPVADDRFSDSAAVVRELETRYHAVPVDQMLLGDVVLFARADDRSYVHSAVYVAADLLFSKNGRSPRAPWVLATLDELKQRYFLGQNIHAMRRNDLE